tara:strand:- start:8503 stop:8691 length:189 start_codon:yes stop_codon:yes gene_type:complete
MKEPKKFSQLYAEWLLTECSEPIDEIEWLHSKLPLDEQLNLDEQFKDKFGYGVHERDGNKPG